ncbi:sodium/proline symporter [Woodsholea maritima]|uniref:sodium/proline symporter n=1 Tax=Woodsholea maritima TaxID=240237 RepID=UPI000380B08D|nr:sodium/proline symporter [Woodsholea maritima]
MSHSFVIILSLVIYKLALIGIGIWASRRTQNESDYFLGGRGLGAWVSGLSYAASTSSAWVLLGFTGFVYSYGVSALWMVPGIWGGYIAVWLGLGERLREEAARCGHLTLSDFLGAGVSKEWARAISILSAILILFTFVFYIAAQFGAAGLAFRTQLGLGQTEALIIGAVVVLIYSFIGGFWAVAVTDTLQGALMALSAIILPVIAVIAAGGPVEIYQTLAAQEPSAYLHPFGERTFFGFLGFALGIMAIGLGPMGQPHLIARLMAVKDEKARWQGFFIAMLWAVLVFSGMAALALAGRALISNLGDGETLFYVMAGALLPVVLSGLVIAAVLSAVMSTVDSLLIAAGAAGAHDLGLTRLFKGREVLISRLIITILCVFAVILALIVPASIFTRVLFAWAALGAAFGPVVIARVCGVEPKGWAIIASILLGFNLTVLFYTVGQMPMPPQSADGLVAGLIRMAHTPGDPFERILPWIPALLLVFGVRQRRESDDAFGLSAED